MPSSSRVGRAEVGIAFSSDTTATLEDRASGTLCRARLLPKRNHQDNGKERLAPLAAWRPGGHIHDCAQGRCRQDKRATLEGCRRSRPPTVLPMRESRKRLLVGVMFGKVEKSGWLARDGRCRPYLGKGRECSQAFVCVQISNWSLWLHGRRRTPCGRRGGTAPRWSNHIGVCGVAPF